MRSDGWRFSQPPRLSGDRARLSFPSFLNFLTSSPSPPFLLPRARVLEMLVCWKSIKLQFTLEIQCFTIITSYEGKENKSAFLSLSLFLSRPFETVKEEVEKIACALPACVSNVSYNFSYFLSRLPAVLFACLLTARICEMPREFHVQHSSFFTLARKYFIYNSDL